MEDALPDFSPEPLAGFVSFGVELSFAAELSEDDEVDDELLARLSVR